MYQIDNQSRKPVYEQIQEQIENYILLGVLKSGDQLMSVRAMSLQLHLNPNTVQRAYQELERKGEIYSLSGIGSYISEDALDILKAEKKKLLVDIEQKLHELILSGITKEDVIELVERIYKEDSK